MTEEKQIEEMACAICGNSRICVGEGVGKCLLHPQMRRYAINAYREGYRQQSDFASEIFTELDRMLSSYSSTHYTISVEEYEAFKNKYIKDLRTMTPEERERHYLGKW